MIHPRTFLSCVAFLLAASVFPGSLFADDFEVGQDGFDTIQEAVDAALKSTKKNNTILIPAGTYDESIFVTLSGTNAQETITVKRKGSGEVRINGVGGEPAIRLDHANNITLKNLTVSSGNPMDGVPAVEVVGLSSNIVMINLLGIPGDDHGVRLVGADVFGASLRGCDFSGMLGDGFSIEGRNHRVTDCVADDCLSNGFRLGDDSANCQLEGVAALSPGASDPMDPGVITVRGSGHRIQNATVNGGGDDGFFVSGAGHRLEDCLATNNAGSGFHVDDAQAEIVGCSGEDNLFGFSGGGPGASVEDSKFRRNDASGVFVTVSGASVISVTSNQNAGNGVLVEAGAVGTQIRGCSTKNNGAEGVRVDGQLTWLEGNRAKGDDGLVDNGVNNNGRDNKVGDGASNDFK